MSEQMIFDAVVPPDQSGERLDVAAAELAGVTRSRAGTLIRDGRVSVDGASQTKPGFKLKAGMLLRVEIPEAAPAVAQPEDIIEYWPKYDTWLERHTKRVSSLEEESGTFREVATRFERLEPDPGKTWNKLAYTYYGQVEAYDLLTNEAAPDCTILLLKDSYSAPIGTFLSLMARHVLCVDMRRDVQPLDWWIEKYHPDAVVMAYSLQMLRDDEYEFG